jgi:shikimate O-hydroxycinnamoyltransferase
MGVTALIPRKRPTPVFDHRSIEFKGVNDIGITKSYDIVAVPMTKIINVTICFTTEFIAELKVCVGFCVAC